MSSGCKPRVRVLRPLSDFFTWTLPGGPGAHGVRGAVTFSPLRKQTGTRTCCASGLPGQVSVEASTVVQRFLQSLSVVGWAWRGVAGLVLRPAIWLPFLLVGCVQAAALLLVVSFHYPALLPIGLPLVKLLAGDVATHYPILYLALPTIYFRMNLAISVLIASIAGGAATLLFARAFGLTREGGAWGVAWRRALPLILTSLLVVALWFGISMLGTLVPQEAQQRSFAARWGVRGGTMLLSIVVQSFLVYTTAWIVLMGHKIGPAIRDSWRVSTRTLLPTLLAVAVPSLLLFPFSYAAGRADFIATKFKPEVVGGLLGVTVAVEVLVTFLLVGTVTRLFVWRMEGAR